MPSPLPDLPNTITDPAVKAFIEKYYAVSNDADVHDDYAGLFIPEGEFSMNDKKAIGTKRNSPPTFFPLPSHKFYSSLNPTKTFNTSPEIRDLRKAIWSHVPGRDHSPVQIYTHGDDQMEPMIHGEVSYKHHAGHETGADWAAKMKLEKQGGEIKVAVYHIIVVSDIFYFFSLFNLRRRGRRGQLDRRYQMG